jgi:hypothetical protein
VALSTQLYKITLNGNINMKTDMPNAIRFGRRAYCGVPFGKKFDQVKLPKLYTIGPINIICPIAVFIKSFPGTGLLVLLNKDHF